jgi:replication factor C small subunit
MDEKYAMWTEKYRPKTFEDIRGHTEIVKRLKGFVESKNMPHVLFSGPAGVGKTSLSLVTARALYGDNWRHNFLELNASDERGIDVVRNKVKDFARTRSLGEIPFKIIYLDESDALTRDAQQALRRTMEKFTRTARFILSCNFSSKILDPIQSRCAVFHFKPLKKEDIYNIIEKIATKENLLIDEAAKEALFTISNGDCRRVENILQSAAVIQKKITVDTVYATASRARPKEVQESLQRALRGNFIGARDMLLKTMLNYGLSGLDLVKQIQREIWNLEIDDRQKVDLVERCGEIEFRLSEGSDDFIQLEALLASFTKAGQHDVIGPAASIQRTL